MVECGVVLETVRGKTFVAEQSEERSVLLGVVWISAVSWGVLFRRQRRLSGDSGLTVDGGALVRDWQVFGGSGDLTVGRGALVRSC